MFDEKWSYRRFSFFFLSHISFVVAVVCLFWSFFYFYFVFNESSPVGRSRLCPFVLFFFFKKDRFTEFYRVLLFHHLDRLGKPFYRVLPSFSRDLFCCCFCLSDESVGSENHWTEFYRVLPSFTEFYLALGYCESVERLNQFTWLSLVATATPSAAHFILPSFFFAAVVNRIPPYHTVVIASFPLVGVRPIDDEVVWALSIDNGRPSRRPDPAFAHHHPIIDS